MEVLKTLWIHSDSKNKIMFTSKKALPNGGVEKRETTYELAKGEVEDEFDAVCPENRNTEATLQGLVDEYNMLSANAEANKDFVKKRVAVFKQILEICGLPEFMIKAEELDYLDGFGVICKRLSVVCPKKGDGTQKYF